MGIGECDEEDAPVFVPEALRVPKCPSLAVPSAVLVASALTPPLLLALVEEDALRCPVLEGVCVPVSAKRTEMEARCVGAPEPLTAALEHPLLLKLGSRVTALVPLAKAVKQAEPLSGGLLLAAAVAALLCEIKALAEGAIVALPEPLPAQAVAVPAGLPLAEALKEADDAADAVAIVNVADTVALTTPLWL